MDASSKVSSAATISATAAYQAFANGIVQSLDALSKERSAWENTDYKKANEGLYHLLAECLNVFQTKFVDATANERKCLNSELVARLKADNISTRSSSNTLTMFVRFVFKSDRKRAHGYANVLKAAISHGIKAVELPGFIISKGGIEEIKRKMVQSEKGREKQAKLAEAKVAIATKVELAETNPITKLYLPNVSGEHVVLIAKPLPDGYMSIIGVLPDVSKNLYEGLIKQMALHHFSDQEAVVKQDQEVSDLLANPNYLEPEIKMAA